jgi:hypothetical protein
LKVVVSLALIALSLLLASVAPAASRISTGVTVHISPGGTADYFYGLVKARKRACRTRQLEVLRDPDGASGYSPYASGLLSNADGTWTLDPSEPIPNGFYKAVAAKKVTGSRVCKRGRSAPFFVD